MGVASFAAGAQPAVGGVVGLFVSRQLAPLEVAGALVAADGADWDRDPGADADVAAVGQYEFALGGQRGQLVREVVFAGGGDVVPGAGYGG